ncbi:MAG: 4-alpha-glucanotransferase, partial [Gemmatimonadaceae bacterium]
MRNALSPLHQLASHAGILPEYLDQSGTELRRTPDETRVALLAAMGIDASTEERARAECERIEREERGRLLAPVRVVTERHGGRMRVDVSLPEEYAGGAEWVLELSNEQGDVHRREGRARRGARTMRLALPTTPGAGYHEVRFRLRGEGAEREGRQRLIVTPATCLTPAQVLDGKRAFGITANLYTVRSARNWGAGDLTDLRELLRWTGEIGGEFVGVNPLHALRNRGVHISPYS